MNFLWRIEGETNNSGEAICHNKGINRGVFLFIYLVLVFSFLQKSSDTSILQYKKFFLSKRNSTSALNCWPSGPTFPET